MTLEEMRLEILKLHEQVWKLEVLTSGWKANLLYEYLNRITKLEAANDAHEEKFRNLWHEIEDLKSGVSALHSGFEGLHELESRADEPEVPRLPTASEQEELPVVD